MINPESKFQSDAIEYLKAKNIYCLNLHGDGFGGRGKPDLIACIGGQFAAFELKVGKNTMSDAQKLHKIWIQRSGGLFFSPYTLDEFKSIVDKLEKEALYG